MHLRDRHLRSGTAEDLRCPHLKTTTVLSTAAAQQPQSSHHSVGHAAMYSLTVTQKDLEISIKPTVLLIAVASTLSGANNK